VTEEVRAGEGKAAGNAEGKAGEGRL